MGKHEYSPDSPDGATSRRLKAIRRLRRIRRERHSPRYVAAGIVGAIAVGAALATLNGNSAAAESDLAVSSEPVHLVQASWSSRAAVEAVDAEADPLERTDLEAEAELLEQAAVVVEAQTEQEKAERIEAQAPEIVKPEAIEIPDPEWISPSDDAITSRYGQRWGRLHAGVDFGNDFGDPIWTIADGTVVYAGWMSGYGNLVVVDHGGGVETAYAHASEVLVGVGDKVEQGDQVSVTGSTGNSTGPHLHFEVRIDGDQVEPLSWLADRDVAIE